VNATQLAQIHGVTRETIRQWTVAGCPRRQDGSYVVAETITWRIQREIEKERKARSPEDDAPKLTEMNRKLRAEADLKELQLERERGELIPTEEHEEIVSRIAGGFAAVAAGQLTRFERRIVQAATPADARVLTQDIHRALMEGAQGLADDLESEADGLEAVAAEADA
jgi:phage terminase Nu1 subunit (DNA packaging protein)